MCLTHLLACVFNDTLSNSNYEAWQVVNPESEMQKDQVLFY